MTTITARGFKLRDGIREKVDEELKRIEKMLPESAECDVTLTYKHEEFKCDITVRHIGTFVRGEAVSDEVLPSIDFAVDDLKRKLRKLKTKLSDRGQYPEYDELVSNVEEVEEMDAENIIPNYVLKRVKYISPKTMTDEEAALQMEMLGHSFFVYVDVDGLTAIVYKQKDGKGYGKLICS